MKICDYIWCLRYTYISLHVYQLHTVNNNETKIQIEYKNGRPLIIFFIFFSKQFHFTIAHKSKENFIDWCNQNKTIKSKDKTPDNRHNPL